MYKGTVIFTASFKGFSFLHIEPLEFRPVDKQIEKISISAPKGDIKPSIGGIVYLSKVKTKEYGADIAITMINRALDWLTHKYDVVIESANVTGSAFTTLNPESGEKSSVSASRLCSVTAKPNVSDVLEATITPPSSEIKKLLESEPSSIPGENNLWLYRAALRSESQIEEFMHLYQILMLLLSGGTDKQKFVDDFIRNEEPNVPQTPHPDNKWNETVYSRLRNELTHNRLGLDPYITKEETKKYLPGLRRLTKTAILQSG